VHGDPWWQAPPAREGRWRGRPRDVVQGAARRRSPWRGAPRARCSGGPEGFDSRRAPSRSCPTPKALAQFPGEQRRAFSSEFCFVKMTCRRAAPGVCRAGRAGARTRAWWRDHRSAHDVADSGRAAGEEARHRCGNGGRSRLRERGRWQQSRLKPPFGGGDIVALPTRRNGPCRRHGEGDGVAWATRTSTPACRGAHVFPTRAGRSTAGRRRQTVCRWRLRSSFGKLALRQRRRVSRLRPARPAVHRRSRKRCFRAPGSRRRLRRRRW